MKKIMLANFFGALLMFTLNVNASTTMSWVDTPSINSFGLETDALYGFNTSTVTVSADINTDDYLDTYVLLDDWAFSVDPAVSDSITSEGNSNFENTNVHLTVDPVPASVWLFGSVVLGIGGLASRRKSLPG